MVEREDNKPVPQPSATPEQIPESPTAGEGRRRGLVSFRAEYAGPVPPPDMIQAYEDVYPGAAALIFEAWQTQANHRRRLEARVIDADIRAEWRGMHLAFALSAIAIIGGVILIALGKDIYGLAAILTPLALLAGVFFYSKRQQRKELDEKAPEDPESPRRLPLPGDSKDES